MEGEVIKVVDVAKSCPKLCCEGLMVAEKDVWKNFYIFHIVE